MAFGNCSGIRNAVQFARDRLTEASPRRRVSERLANAASGVAVTRRRLQVKRLFRRLCETPEPRVSERLAYVFVDEGTRNQVLWYLTDQQKLTCDFLFLSK